MRSRPACRTLQGGATTNEVSMTREEHYMLAERARRMLARAMERQHANHIEICMAALKRHTVAVAFTRPLPGGTTCFQKQMMRPPSSRAKAR